MIRNFIVFLLLIILTFYIIFKDQDISQILVIIDSGKKQFIAVGVICMLFYLSCEAINIGRTLKVLNEKSTFLKNLKYAFIGFFFSSITPAASGGQPMQVYFMHQDNISVANATLTLLINLSCVQIVTISLAMVSLLLNYQYLNVAMLWFLFIGIFLNLSALTLLFISIFSKRATKWLIKVAIKVLKFFRAKDIEKKQIRFQEELSQYQVSAIYIRSHKLVMLKTLLTTYAQFLVFYSISYWVYRTFGMTEYSIGKIITMQSVLYATVSGIPLPGAVGVSEGGFIAIFHQIYPEYMVSGAMLLNRGISFYLFVLLSLVVVVVSLLRGKKQEMVEENKGEETDTEKS